jgi:hypothetical protein
MVESLTIVPTMPGTFSFWVHHAATKRTMIVTGMDAIVSADSTFVVSLTMTRNCTSKPRNKKKSNLRTVM